ncbi:F-box protein At2g27310-like [Bidens hawaiensis]|uniref:F-box protein At2g27310-like n=1 Tax=Bidens hawaiensis TaxID=980011 RepID=UPI00404A2EED
MLAEPITKMSNLNDIFYDILRRLDGTTLASAACVCAAFKAISKEESLWEDVCSSMWPSTKRDDVKFLISSTGGFKKFYADCFPFIVNKNVPEFSYPEYPGEWTEAEYYGDYDELESVSPSDFVSIVDIKYKEKTICSKVLWGIPNASVHNGWFSDCPFRIDLFSYASRDNDDAGEVTLSVSDGLPPVTSIEQERKDGKLWQELRDGIRLSWIIVNSKVKQAANVSSWCAVDGQRHWPTSQDFVLHFGSIVPAKDIVPSQVVKCIITMKFRATHIEGSGTHTTLNLTELCMKLGDMDGGHVKGRNSLFVLKEALTCDRSKDHGLVLESCRLYSRVQSEIKEEKIRHDNRVEGLHILVGIAAFALLCCYFL